MHWWDNPKGPGEEIHPALPKLSCSLCLGWAQSSWSCPEDYRGWGTHQRLYPSSLLLYSGISLDFFPFQSLSGYYLWCINTGSSAPSLPLTPGWFWSFSTLFCSVHGWKGINSTREKSWTSLYPPKLGNTRKHWKITQDPLFFHACSLKRALCWISDGSQCRPPLLAPSYED